MGRHSFFSSIPEATTVHPEATTVQHPMFSCDSYRSIVLTVWPPAECAA